MMFNFQILITALNLLGNLLLVLIKGATFSQSIGQPRPFSSVPHRSFIYNVFDCRSEVFCVFVSHALAWNAGYSLLSSLLLKNEYQTVGTTFKLSSASKGILFSDGGSAFNLGLQSFNGI